jgi:hypothetical protein
MIEKNLKRNILQQCKKFAVSNNIKAAFLYGASLWKFSKKEQKLNILLVLNSFKSRLVLQTTSINRIPISILMVDQRVFEQDIAESRFGDFFSDKIAFPMIP